MKRQITTAKRMILVAALLAGSATCRAQAALPASHAAPAQVSPAPAAEVTANPAIWRVQGAHATVYLFGTVHVLRPSVKWQTKKVMDDLGKSDTIYLEIAKLDDMASLQPLVMQLGMDQEHPLSTKISAEDKAALDKAMKEMGMPGEQMVEPMQPWLAYMTLSVLPIIKAGYSPTSGVDVAIAQAAKDSNKPVLGFETMEQQLHYLADFPQAQQVMLLHDEIQDLPAGPAKMNEIAAAWEKGDVDTIAKVDNEAIRKSPELYRKLVVERNARFADQLGKVLAGDKATTLFVAVGAAHLAGPDSVQKDLEARGYKVTRE